MKLPGRIYFGQQLTTGFRSADQSKIRLAISLRRIDSGDIPASARVSTSVGTTPSLPGGSRDQSRRKRTVSEAGFESSPIEQNSSISQEQQQEAAETEVVECLYCQMECNVVGIQYYTGISVSSPINGWLRMRLGLVGPGEEVQLTREPHNPYDAYAFFQSRSL